MKYLMLVLAVLFCGASSALAGEYICAPEASSCFGEICVDLTYTNTGGSPHCNVDAVGWDCVYDSDKLEFVGVQIMGELGHFDETAYNDGVYEDCKIAENCRRLRISGIDVYEFHCLSTSVWAKVTFNIIPSGSGSTVLEQCGYTADINACTPCQTTIDW